MSRQIPCLWAGASLGPGISVSCSSPYDSRICLHSLALHITATFCNTGSRRVMLFPNHFFQMLCHASLCANDFTFPSLLIFAIALLSSRHFSLYIVWCHCPEQQYPFSCYLLPFRSSAWASCLDYVVAPNIYILILTYILSCMLTSFLSPPVYSQGNVAMSSRIFLLSQILTFSQCGQHLYLPQHSLCRAEMTFLPILYLSQFVLLFPSLGIFSLTIPKPFIVCCFDIFTLSIDSSLLLLSWFFIP